MLSPESLLEGTLPILPPDEDGNPRKDTITLVGGVNTIKKRILEHIDINIRRQLSQIKRYQLQDTNIILACGGPSLKTNIKSLKRQYDKGYKVVSVNGSHDYLQDQGIKPAMHIMIDARPWNARFVQRPIDSCRYVIASQCHPDVFDALKDNDVNIYHVDVDEEVAEILDKFYVSNQRYINIVGGSTVTLCSFIILRTLGFKYFDIYGFDSCFMDKKHHAYDQPENKEKPINILFEDGKRFVCSTWMVRQAYDFQQLVSYISKDLFKCRVHGNGLIAHMMKTGAAMKVEEVKE